MAVVENRENKRAVSNNLIFMYFSSGFLNWRQDGMLTIATLINSAYSGAL
jgi:hypothetical protein